MGILDTLRRKGGRGDDIDRHLEEGLYGLRLISPDTLRRAMEYIRSGAGAEVLLEIEAAPGRAEVAVPFGTVVLHPTWRNWISAEVQARIGCNWTGEVGSLARNQFYACAPADQLARLGRLLNAIAAVESPSTGIPAWLIGLLNDALMSRDTVDRKKKLTDQQMAALWSPARLEAIASAGGVPDAEVPGVVLRVLLDRAPAAGSWSTDYYGVLLESREALDYLVAHADVVRQVLPSTHASCRDDFVGRLSKEPAAALVFADLIAQLAVDTAKTVRRPAIALLCTLPVALEMAAPLVTATPVARLGELASALAALPGGGDVLRRAAEAEKPGARRTLLERAADRGETASATAEIAEDIEVPAFAPATEVVLGEEWVAAARAAIDAQLAAAQQTVAEATAAGTPRNNWTLSAARGRVETFSKVTDSGLRDMASYLCGVRPDAPKGLRNALEDNRVVSALPEFGLLAALRLCVVGSPPKILWWRFRLLGRKTGDLRTFVDALARVGIPEPDKAADELVFSQWNSAALFTVDQLWPYYLGRPERLEIALGMRPGDRSNSFDQPHQVELAIEILGAMPQVPAAFVPALTSLALGEGKTHRRSAQRVLESHHVARALGEQGLTDTKSQIRAASANWLGRIGDSAALPALLAAVKKEKQPAARAALLTAIETLGGDICAYLAPDVLVAEAAKGLKAKAPASLGWFPMDALPVARWATGGQVPAEVIRWWVIVADKLKDPSGAGIFTRYLSLLDEPSRSALGSFILHAWIGEDTRHPDPEESAAHGRGLAQQRFDNAQINRKRYGGKGHDDYWEAEAAKSVADHEREAYRQHQSQYISSAIADKGLLALTVGAPGADLASAAASYIKDNTGRRAQVGALVSALAAHGGQEPIQLLLTVARRFRQATVQSQAQELVTELAEARGWTPDQLADRTVATAGLDDDGILRLDLGSRTVTGRVTEAFTLELANPEDKAIKALPAQRQDDDPEMYKAAKAQLSASRKELKQIVALQRSRLYEAMCTGRVWPTVEWTEFIAGHPLMSRLAERLVWIENPGDGQRLFRPSGGELIDAADETITLGDDGSIALAHARLVDAATAEAWRAHMRDYQVPIVFDQLDAPAPPAPGVRTEVDDHQGWLADSFTIRGRATKLGYSRSQAEDAGWFTAYTKAYDSVQLVAVISFTGAYLPEENIPAAVRTLSFERSRGGATVPLAEVPPVLYAESYRDYVTVASGGAFDPDWERKSAY